MPLITRQYGPNAKGSKLTIEEMDDNLLYLQGSYTDLGNSSTIPTIDWADYDIQEINLDNNPTLTFANAEPGQDLALLIYNNGAAVRSVTWPDNVIWNNDTPVDVHVPMKGNLDTTFTTNSGSGFNNLVFALAVQADKKILCGGTFSTYDGQTRNKIARLNADGTIDDSFVTGIGFNSGVNSIGIQSDGKILCVGTFISYGGVPVNRIARLNATSGLDNSFTSGSGFNGVFTTTVAIQSDDKILVGGDFTTYDGNAANRIIRLNSDGTIDNGFGTGSGFDSSVRVIKIQTDGKILVGGDFTSYNGVTANRIIRLNSDGTIDNGFDTGSGFDSSVFTIALGFVGRIVIGGAFTSYNGVSANRITNVQENGIISNKFAINIGSSFAGGYPRTISSFDDGASLIVGGDFTSFNGTNYNRLLLLLDNGEVDTNFSTNETGFDFTVWSSAVGLEDKLIMGGGFGSYSSIPCSCIAQILSEPEPGYHQINFVSNGTDYIGSF